MEFKKFDAGQILTEIECAMVARRYLEIFSETDIDLTTAEAMLEDVRRIIWTAKFSGHDVELTWNAIGKGAQPVARTIATHLAPLSLLTAEEVITQMRFGMYMALFSQSEVFAFGRWSKSREEEQARYSRRAGSKPH